MNETNMEREELGLSKEELLEVRRCAARGQRRNATLLDLAILQLLREQFWRELRIGFNVQTVKTVVPLILSVRRIELLERRESEERAGRKRQLGIAEEGKIMGELFGTLPAMEAAAASV